MPPSRWFAQVLMEASYPSEPIVLEELERVLDAAQPTKIDPTKCYAIDGSFFIAHAEDCWGDIEIEVDADHATIGSEISQRQIAAEEFGDRWARLVAQEIDQIIRGKYRSAWTRWRDKIIHTTVTDRAGTTIRDTRFAVGAAAPSGEPPHPRSIRTRLRMLIEAPQRQCPPRVPPDQSTL